MEYRITKKFSTRVDRTPRVLEVAEAFGIGLQDKDFVIYDDLPLNVDQGDVVYITGQSGSGKSQLLKELKRLMVIEGLEIADIDEILLEPKAPLIEQVGKNMTDAVRILSAAGLNDAYLFVRQPGELSDGQRYRMRLAKIMQSNAKVWIADEFTATLDRITAKVVASCLQKLARSVGATVIVATTHMDLADDLKPSLVVKKHFRNKVEVTAGA